MIPAVRPATPLDVAALLAALPDRIADAPARRAAHAPAQPALIEDARRLSYGELAQAVDAAAERLAALGVRGGDRVMIVAENSVAQIVLLFAAARIDAWALMSNARLSAGELDAIAAHFTLSIAQPATAPGSRSSSVPCPGSATRSLRTGARS